MLILIFSVLLYHYIKITIYENVVFDLKMVVKNIENLNSLDEISMIDFEKKLINCKIEDYKNDEIKFENFKKMDENFLSLSYPIKKFKKTFVLQKNTTNISILISQILSNIIIVNATMIFLIIFYAIFLSRILLLPIKTISQNLTSQNEKILNQIDEKNISEEFLPLAQSINSLITRIKNFIGYQKELFVGIAHELKTPLAVMKTKNEVTLIKPRDMEKYIETLKSNNEAINNMNKMISQILEIGRQESAQFEEPQKCEMITHLKNIAKNFEILTNQSGIRLICEFSPNAIFINIRATLLMHILQNFIQNAIKFSENGSEILLKTYVKNSKFVIEIIDEGEGIDESKDLFAPFKRFGNKSGAGLGLFLAKTASDAMNAEISIKNRENKKGSIASLKLPIV